MTYYRNVKWTKRHYECTNIVGAKSDGEAPFGECWVPCEEEDLPEGLNPIHRMGDVVYLGYM